MSSESTAIYSSLNNINVYFNLLDLRLLYDVLSSLQIANQSFLSTPLLETIYLWK